MSGAVLKPIAHFLDGSPSMLVHTACWPSAQRFRQHVRRHGDNWTPVYANDTWFPDGETCSWCKKPITKEAPR